MVLSPFDESAFGPAYRPENRDNPLTVLEQKELRQRIWNALAQLPENYRVILILRYQMDLNNQEIADTLGIKKDNVEVRMHRPQGSATVAKIRGKRQVRLWRYIHHYLMFFH